MSYYEFTVQIYENEEVAKKVYGNIKSMELDIHSCVSVLWKINKEVIT